MGAENDMHETFLRLFQIRNNWNNVLYFHTPFCLQKCKYCAYRSSAKFAPEEFNEFYDRTIPLQIKKYRRTFQTTAFNEVYFGGGTPTIATAAMLKRMYDQIPHFKNIPIKSTEASPYTITDEHIELFDRCGFSYVSLGIQSLSKKILKKNNRLFVSRERLKSICEKFEKTKIIYNFDLICYLDEGGKKDIFQFQKDLEYIMSTLRPISITIHSNYKARNSKAKTRLLICLIKDMVHSHQEYKCVNSLLQLRDIKSDMNYKAEYRLMRKSFDFFNYLWAKYPSLPPYGFNILALGSCDQSNIYVNSNIGVCCFSPKTEKISPLYIQSVPMINFDLIRKKLGLSHPPNRHFFSNKEERKKYINLFISALSKTEDISKAITILNLLESDRAIILSQKDPTKLREGYYLS